MGTQIATKIASDNKNTVDTSYVFENSKLGN